MTINRLEGQFPLPNGQPPPDGPVSTDDAQRAVEEERQRRATACQEVINRALAEHDCRLVTIQQIVGGQPGPVEVRVVPA